MMVKCLMFVLGSTIDVHTSNRKVTFIVTWFNNGDWIYMYILIVGALI